MHTGSEDTKAYIQELEKEIDRCQGVLEDGLKNCKTIEEKDAYTESKFYVQMVVRIQTLSQVTGDLEDLAKESGTKHMKYISTDNKEKEPYESHSV